MPNYFAGHLLLIKQIPDTYLWLWLFHKLYTVVFSFQVHHSIRSSWTPPLKTWNRNARATVLCPISKVPKSTQSDGACWSFSFSFPLPTLSNGSSTPSSAPWSETIMECPQIGSTGHRSSTWFSTFRLFFLEATCWRSW